MHSQICVEIPQCTFWGGVLIIHIDDPLVDPNPHSVCYAGYPRLPPLVETNGHSQFSRVEEHANEASCLQLLVPRVPPFQQMHATLTTVACHSMIEKEEQEQERGSGATKLS